MESLILVLVVIGALLVIASGVWVAVALIEVISPGRGPVDTPATKTQNHKPM